MKIYLVGGAVRDKLLGLPVEEKDWVVVGATPEEMLSQGFQPVGKEFPVFLHPKTHEEYALARTEKKMAKGYKGFTFYTDKNVTLEEDLLRRDLTMNAIAEDDDGNLIDPYGGQQDLKNKIFRHVSPAFSEDPVRILRLARFASRFMDFSIANETLALMKKMVVLGEIQALVAERVWQECRRALSEKNPARFFQILSACDALSILFPEIKQLNLEDLNKAMIKTIDPKKRFAALCAHFNLAELKRVVQKYKIPNDYADLAKLLIQHREEYQQFNRLNPEAVLCFLAKSDALRRPDRFYDFLDVADICFDIASDRQTIKTILANIKQIDVSVLQNQGLKGQAFADAIKQMRIDIIRKLKGT